MMSYPPKHSTYLGDGLYCWRDHANQIWLAAKRSEGWHYVVLEPAVLGEFLNYVERQRTIAVQNTK